MKVTIYDIAKKVGVSTATVSKVINNTGSISEKTRLKIQKAIEEMQYEPNVFAAALNGKSTSTVGLLIPDLANPIFSEYARSIEDRAHELGFSVVMCSTDSNPEKETRYLSLLKQKRVDGFIIAAKTNNIKFLENLIKKEKIPVVLIAHDIPLLPIDSVTVDDCLGGFQVTEHLISLGHKRIGFLAEDAWSSKERIRGYQQALSKAGIEFDASLIQVCKPPNLESAQIQAAKLLGLSERPTAIFGSNDTLAVGAMQAAQKMKLNIPNDLSIIGFDNSDMSRVVEPPLSTVIQPIKEIGHQAMNLLIQKIEGKGNVGQRIVLLPKLVLRESTSKLVN